MTNPEKPLSRPMRTHYPAELRSRVSADMVENGLSYEDAAKKYGIPKGTASTWKARALIAQARKRTRPQEILNTLTEADALRKGYAALVAAILSEVSLETFQKIMRKVG